MKSYQTLSLHADKDRGRVRVSLRRPERRNAMNLEMMNELRDCFSELHRDDELRLIELVGEGKCFCSGADLSWMKSGGAMTAQEASRDSESLMEMLRCVEATPQVLVAKVHGAVMGGGLGLIACCDEVVAQSDTRFRLPELRIGLIPAMISPFLFKKIGYSHGLALCLSARPFSAQEAKEVGLVHRVVDDIDQDPFAEHVDHAPLASRKAKAFLRQHYRPPEDPELQQRCIEIIAALRQGDEAQAGIAALLNKTQAPWSL